MKNIIKFLPFLILHMLQRKFRFVRLSPNLRGRIFFFDKSERRFFSVASRGRSDSITADQIFALEEYDLKFMARYDELLRIYEKTIARGKIPLIVDCGANIGLSARYFSAEFPQAAVVAIEPEYENFVAMTRNCAGSPAISCRNLAVGASEGKVSVITESDDNRSFATARNPPDSEGVEVVTIDKIYGENQNFEPFIVKIDIEGFEHDLFSENTGWFSITPLVIIETHDWMLPGQASAKNFLMVASQEDRDFLHRGENVFSLSNHLAMV